MSDEWVERVLADLVDILDSQRRPVSADERQRRPGKVPYYGATGQAGWIDDCLFNEPLVLLGEDAVDFGNSAAHKAYVVRGPSWVNNHAHVLRAREESVLSDFLCHALNLVDYSPYASFGTRSKLTQAKMREIRLRVPPLPIQRRIVDLMTHTDTHLANLQAERERLQIARGAVLNAAMAGELPVAPMNFEWQSNVKSLYSLATWTNGFAFKASDFTGSGRPIIKIAEVKGGVGPKTDLTTNVWDEKYLVRRGDLLFCWSGQPETSIGSAIWLGEEGWLNQHLFNVRPVASIVRRAYMHYLLEVLKPTFVEIAKRKQSTGLGHVTKEDLVALEVQVPTTEIQDNLVALMTGLDAQVRALDDEHHRLRLLRFGLLARLLHQSAEISDGYDELLDGVA